MYHNFTLPYHNHMLNYIDTHVTHLLWYIDTHVHNAQDASIQYTVNMYILSFTVIVGEELVSCVCIILHLIMYLCLLQE